MGGHGNDNIDGGWGKDYLLLDGSMQDYTFAVTRRGVTVTNSTGEVDTVKNVEVFHFSDGTNYLVGRHGLVQTGDQTINSFLAASGVDQSLLGPVSTAQTQQAPVQSANPTSSNASVTGASVGSADPHPSTSVATAPTSPGTIPPITQQHNESFGGITSDQLSAIFGQALNQAGHPQGVDKVLTNAALWNAVDAASNSPTHADSVLADLKQQLHDAFDHNVEQPTRWMSSPRCFIGRITNKGPAISGTLPAQGPSFHLAYQWKPRPAQSCQILTINSQAFSIGAAKA